MNSKQLELDGFDGGKLKLFHDNIGDPFRQGLSMIFEHDGDEAWVMLSYYECKRLRDALDQLIKDKENGNGTLAKQQKT